MPAKPPPTEAEVLAALASYRAHILDVNRRIFTEQMVPELLQEEPGEDDELDEDVEDLRVAFLTEVIGYPEGATPRLERVADLPGLWDQVAPQCLAGLDGTSVFLPRLFPGHDPDKKDAAEVREQAVEAYRRSILLELEGIPCPAASSGGGESSWELPADWETVVRHADGLVGPGWEHLRTRSERMQFWKGLDDLGPVAAGPGMDGFWLDEVLERYDVAAGWSQGCGNECANYVIFCRPKDYREEGAGGGGGGEGEGGKEEAGQGGWSWRYVAQLGGFAGFELHIFDDVVALLDWYKSFDEPTETDKDLCENGWEGF